MRMKFNLLIYFVGLLIVACNKCPDKKMIHTPLPSEMEKYFGNYQPGKYWVYANKTNTIRDSVYIADFEQTNTMAEPSSCHSYERRKFRLVGLNHLCDESASSVSFTFYETGGVYTDNNAIPSPRCGFDFAYDQTNNKFNTFDSTIFFLPQIILNGEVYYDILAKHIYSNPYDVPQQKHYFANGIGLVGYWGEQFGDTLNLIDHN